MAAFSMSLRYVVQSADAVIFRGSGNLACAIARPQMLARALYRAQARSKTKASDQVPCKSERIRPSLFSDQPTTVLDKCALDSMALRPNCARGRSSDLSAHADRWQPISGLDVAPWSSCEQDLIPSGAAQSRYGVGGHGCSTVHGLKLTALPWCSPSASVSVLHVRHALHVRLGGRRARRACYPNLA